MKRLREIPEPSAELDAARNRLFKHFGLDPTEPEHWPLVVDCIAFAEFRGKPGRPKKSSPITDAYVAAAITKAKGISDSALARKMEKIGKFSELGGHRSIRAHLARIKKSARTGK
jgi:hypothetical protein